MQRRRAFTLIELLVVIAIIGILAGLLLPVLSRAKARGQMVTDLNNTKQILLGAHMYAGDSSDAMARPGWQIPFSCWAYGYPFPYNTAGGSAGYNATIQGQLDAFNHGQLASYIKTQQILMCPGDKPNSLLYERQMNISSYVWNGAVSSFDNSTDKTYKLGQFKPTDILLWESDETVPSSFNDGADMPFEGFTRRHGGSADGDQSEDSSSMVTMGVFDGSTKRMQAKELVRLAGEGTDNAGPPPGTVEMPNALWCNPGSTNGAESPFN